MVAGLTGANGGRVPNLAKVGPGLVLEPAAIRRLRVAAKPAKELINFSRVGSDLIKRFSSLMTP